MRKSFKAQALPQYYTISKYRSVVCSLLTKALLFKEGILVDLSPAYSLDPTFRGFL